MSLKSFRFDPRVVCAACGHRYVRRFHRCPLCRSDLRRSPTVSVPLTDSDGGAVSLEDIEGTLGDGNYFSPIHELSDVTSR